MKYRITEFLDVIFDRIDEKFPWLSGLTAKIWGPGHTPHGEYERGEG